MTFSIEQAKAFIVDAKKYRDNWLPVANKSWAEIKKRKKNNTLWSTSPNSVRKQVRYPAWYSIFRIRQPLLLSRVGVPICKDTTQDGSDPIGATAAMCLERLAINIVKTFDFFETLCSARDDFLITDFGEVRAYYERETVKEHVKDYLTPQQIINPLTQQPEQVLVDSLGQIVMSNEVYQDDNGFFIEREEIIDVENEKVCLEPILYKNFYVDPGVTRWSRCKRIAFEENYSLNEFKEIFGRKAMETFDVNEDDDVNADKKQNICVYEYWDKYEGRPYWWVDNGTDFIEPKNYSSVNDNEESSYSDEETRNGLYDLEGFFPVPTPLITHGATDEFWPVTEYYQLMAILEDVHTIFSRLVSMTRAIRPRLLFDNNVEGLKEVINEASTNDAFGVPNLAQALTAAGGNLTNVVQYLPVAEIINGIQQLYVALEQRLSSIYRFTGTSDLLQGLSSDPVQRTFGERQMTEKYALNQIAEPQRKMAEFVRNCYDLVTEMALKNFKDESLTKYIMPKTLPPENQQYYVPGLELLKSDRKRFRIDLETDSTITLNEQYDKQMRIELVNTMTAALEKTASVSPELMPVELHALKFLIQGFRQGKMFQAEITTAIDNVMKQLEAQSQQPPPPDKDMMALDIQKMGIESNERIQISKAQLDQQLESAKLNFESQMAVIKNQLEQFKIAVEQGNEQEKLRLEYEKLNASILEAKAQLDLQSNQLMVEVKKVNDTKDLKQIELLMQEQVKPFEQQLEAHRQQIDIYELQMREQDQKLEAQEQMLVAQRAAADNELEKLRLAIDARSVQAEATKPPDVHIHMPEPKASKKKIRVQRDELGNITNLESEDVSSISE